MILIFDTIPVVFLAGFKIVANIFKILFIFYNNGIITNKLAVENMKDFSKPLNISSLINNRYGYFKIM